MATIRKRGNTYQIRVSCGYDINGNQVIKTTTWKPSPTMTERQAEKEVQRQATLFEEKCLNSQVAANIKFESLAEEWMENYAKINLKSNTYQRLKSISKRVYTAFGHLRIDKITRRQVQSFIDDLIKNGRNLLFEILETAPIKYKAFLLPRFTAVSDAVSCSVWNGRTLTSIITLSASAAHRIIRLREEIIRTRRKPKSLYAR